MTLLIHSTKTNKGYDVEWAMQSGSVCGVHQVIISDNAYDARACAEIEALSHILSKYPGKAGNIQSSNGIIKNMLSAEKTKYNHAVTELGSLQIKYPNLSCLSDKKTAKEASQIISSHNEPQRSKSVWQGLGRPVISSSIVGEVEITLHGMIRYRERFAKTGDLKRLENVLMKPFKELSKSEKDGKTYRVFKSLVSNFCFVITECANSKRFTTCYSAA